MDRRVKSRSLALFAFVFLGLSGAVQATPRAIRVVVYSFPGQWDGRPPSPGQSGWHALARTGAEMGADTGVLAFVSRWDAVRQCWGDTRDCRPPAWAVKQGMHYIGPISGAEKRMSVEVRQ